MRLASVVASVLILSMAGCVETQQAATSGSAPAGAAKAAQVGPGEESVDTLYASIAFADICVDTYGHPEKAKALLLAKGYVQHPQTGTFYNQRQNESFKLMGKNCSMVFGTKDKPGQVAISFAVAVASRVNPNPADARIETDLDKAVAVTKGPKGSTFHIQPTGFELFGQTMFHAVLTAP